MLKPINVRKHHRETTRSSPPKYMTPQTNSKKQVIMISRELTSASSQMNYSYLPLFKMCIVSFRFSAASDQNWDQNVLEYLQVHKITYWWEYLHYDKIQACINLRPFCNNELVQCQLRDNCQHLYFSCDKLKTVKKEKHLKKSSQRKIFLWSEFGNSQTCTLFFKNLF